MGGISLFGGEMRTLLENVQQEPKKKECPWWTFVKRKWSHVGSSCLTIDVRTCVQLYAPDDSTNQPFFCNASYQFLLYHCPLFILLLFLSNFIF